MIFVERKYRRNNRSRRMNDRLQMSVVIIEDVRRDAVYEGGIHDIKGFSTPKNGRLCSSRERRESINGNFDCLVTRAPHSHTNPVKQRTPPFLAHAFR